MKKRIIKISLLLIFIGLFVTGCGNKKSISAEEFKKITEKDYVITDATKQFAGIEEAKHIKKVYIASDKEYKYQVEFYEFDSDENADNFFDHNKEIFETDNGDSNYTIVNMFNYDKYTHTGSSHYYVLSRINNTVAYVNVEDKYKEQVKSILKSIKY